MTNDLLICHRGALGDFILTWPTLLLLRRSLPTHAFIGVGRPDYLRLACSLKLIDQWHDAELSDMLPFFEGSGIPERLGTPDGAVLWLAAGDKTAGLLRRKSILPVVVVQPFPDAPTRHIARSYVDSVETAYPLAPPADLSELFPWRPQDPLDTVLLHPGSGSVKKNFAPALYLSLAERLETSCAKSVLFLLGPAEIERPESTVFLSTGKCKTPGNAVELASLLSHAALFVGNDTGPTHLAGALGVNVIALHKTTDQRIWGALGRHVVHVSSHDERIAEAAALQHAEAALYPPHTRGTEGKGHVPFFRGSDKPRPPLET